MKLASFLAFSMVLLAPISQAAEPAFSLTVLHTNDIHSRVEPAMISKKPYGGYARVATLLKRYQTLDKNVVVLNAGDSFQGTLYYNVYRGAADALLMNICGYDAMTLGNHEFDDGPVGLAPFLRTVQFPVVCCNLDFTNEPNVRNFVRPSTILNVSGERIALIGAMTPDLLSISSPGDQIKMKPLDSSIQTEINKYKIQGINKFILLSHMGYQEDKEIAARIPDLDMIVGGHSHSYLGNAQIPGLPAPIGPYPTLVGNTVIVQAWEWAKLLGRIKVDFDASGNVVGTRDGAPIVVDSTVPEDQMVKSAIVALRKPIEALQNQPVGFTQNGLDRGSTPELPIGSVIADAQLAAMKKAGAVAAFMNRGGVRAPIEPGEITYGEVISVQPFGNTLVVIDLTGKEIQDMLEVGISKGLVQVSAGFFYSVAGQKVTSMTLNGAPVQLDKTYRVVVNNFMARGGDGFVSLQNAKGYRLDTGVLDLDVLIDYLKANNPTDIKIGSRIKASN